MPNHKGMRWAQRLAPMSTSPSRLRCTQLWPASPGPVVGIQAKPLEIFLAQLAVFGCNSVK